MLRVIQLLFAFLLIIKAIGNCNNMNWEVFRFNIQVEHTVIYSIKLLMLFVMSFGLFDIAIKDVAEAFRKNLLVCSLFFIFLGLGQLVLIILVGSNKINVVTDFNFEGAYLFDILVIVFMTLICVYLRHCELAFLFSIGHYKNLDDMTDKEMFAEYEKMRKVSYIMKRKIKRASSGSNDRESKRTSINA